VREPVTVPSAATRISLCASRRTQPSDDQPSSVFAAGVVASIAPLTSAECTSTRER